MEASWGRDRDQWFPELLSVERSALPPQLLAEELLKEVECQSHKAKRFN